VYNTKINLREITLSDMDWIDLAQDRDQWRVVVNTVMDLRVPYLGRCVTGRFSRAAQLRVVRVS
jgi:hypothetical protein